jgi:choline dehydrogenase
MENWHGGDSPLRGTDGPLHVTRGKRRNPLFNAFIEAGQQAGWPYTPDYNGENQEGFGPMEATIWRGRRWSAANAYLRPALKSGKLRVIRALARRVIFVGNRATGVEIQRKGRIETVGAGREVILSASSINTPKLLMLSGIGPADHLREHEIRVRADRPGVGANLQDHLEIYMQYKALKPVSLYTYYNLLGKSRVGIEWLLQKTGLGASNQFESCGFICSGEGVDYPDIQYHFLPLAVRYDGKAAASGHGFQAHVGPMRSKSRGSVRLDSSDPEKPPVIHFNYMSHPDDWKEFRACVRLTRRIFDQPAFKEYRGDEIQPGGEVVTDAQIDGQRVRVGRETLLSLVDKAPSEYTHHGRNSERTVNVGRSSMVVSPSYGPPFIYDLDGVRRTATLEDLNNLQKLNHMASSVHIAGGRWWNRWISRYRTATCIWLTAVLSTRINRSSAMSPPLPGRKIRWTCARSYSVMILQ